MTNTTQYYSLDQLDHHYKNGVLMVNVTQLDAAHDMLHFVNAIMNAYDKGVSLQYIADALRLDVSIVSSVVKQQLISESVNHVVNEI